jgi:triosephosphate isomerase
MLLAGNWKMHGLRGAVAEIRALGRGLNGAPLPADILVCPPATLINEAVKAAEGTRIVIGGQNCHAEPSGAFTGEISAEMLRDAGANAVILGHSERRQFYGETDAMVRAKAEAASRAGLIALICVGEDERQRDAGEAVSVVQKQLDGSVPASAPADPIDLVIAYEPVWAIGTGRTPNPEQIAEMHAAIRAWLADRFGAAADQMRILYGGSVKPENAGTILAVTNVDGALIGGASLKAGDFLAIIRAVPQR